VSDSYVKFREFICAGCGGRELWVFWKNISEYKGTNVEDICSCPRWSFSHYTDIPNRCLVTWEESNV